MTGLDKRAAAVEAAFAHDQKLRFKAMARRNRKLGEWAADLIGLPEILAEEYWKQVVRVDLLACGDEDVFLKIRQDFDKVGVIQSDHQIRRTMDELLEKALQEIQAEG